MRLFALVCAVLMAISAPAFAQNNPPPPDSSDRQDEAPGSFFLSPGGIVLAAVGVGLITWGIIESTKKKNTCASAC